jgi:hypothetical protein
LNNWVQEASNKGVLLDTKAVCSKPCHGLNLVSIEKKDYLYNPCTGFHGVCVNQHLHMRQMWKVPIDRVPQEAHPFSVGNRNVGLGFDPLFQEHIIVEFFYTLKDYKFCQYLLTCSLWSFNSRRLQQLPPPPLPVNDVPPAYLDERTKVKSESQASRCTRMQHQMHACWLQGLNNGNSLWIGASPLVSLLLLHYRRVCHSPEADLMSQIE